jgi:hypothetical protein
MVTRMGRITTLLLFVTLFTVAAAQVPAAEAQEPTRDAASAVFDCPPTPGVYPEPDPCVPISPPPVTPMFVLPIDRSPNVPEWYCDPVTKQGVVQIKGMLRSTYGMGGSTHRACDVTWSYQYSLHKMGLALDWSVDVTDPQGWAAGLSFIRWLLASDDDGNEFALAKRLGITQLIWHNRVWTSANPEWRIYCDPRDVEDADCIRNPTLRHDDHMHISFSLEAGYLHTSYFRTLGFTPIPIPPPPDPLPVEGDAIPSPGNGDGS